MVQPQPAALAFEPNWIVSTSVARFASLLLRLLKVGLASGLGTLLLAELEAVWGDGGPADASVQLLDLRKTFTSYVWRRGYWMGTLVQWWCPKRIRSEAVKDDSLLSGFFLMEATEANDPQKSHQVAFTK